MMTKPTQHNGFGLIVIGDEVLNGPRTDGHLAAFKRLLNTRGHQLLWHWLLPDEPNTLVHHLRLSLDWAVPVFICGGIGATPDDHTRHCAALAAGVALTRHADACAIIERRFGEKAYPHRVLMADLPEGATLIPNPINEMPGFHLNGHWFLPGFPQMAHAMAEWVLDMHFAAAQPLREAAVRVRGTPESELIPVMRQLGTTHPEFKCFSLPHMGEDAHILLGLRGRADPGPALATLCDRLNRAAITFEPVTPHSTDGTHGLDEKGQ